MKINDLASKDLDIENIITVIRSVIPDIKKIKKKYKFPVITKLTSAQFKKGTPPISIDNIYNDLEKYVITFNISDVSIQTYKKFTELVAPYTKYPSNVDYFELKDDKRSFQSGYGKWLRVSSWKQKEIRGTDNWVYISKTDAYYILTNLLKEKAEKIIKKRYGENAKSFLSKDMFDRLIEIEIEHFKWNNYGEQI